MLTYLLRTGRKFFGIEDGNVTILFALSLVPLIGLVGIGIDYGIALNDKSRLDHAADAAAVNAVSAAKAYIAANPSDPNAYANAVTAGQAQASSAFAVNSASIVFASVGTPTISVTANAGTFNATVSYTATTQNHFGQIFGVSTFNLQGTSSAVAAVNKYLDFYILIDVSGSMGLPSTSAGMSQLAAINSDMGGSCVFACHFPGSVGWNAAVSNNIQLRSGAVNSAVCSLLQRAATPAVPNQYRIGLYPFIDQMGTLAAITSNVSSLQTTAGCSSSNPMVFTNLLDTGQTQLSTGNNPYTGTGAGGTHFETALQQILSAISPFGDGTSQLKSKPFVFIITDGMQNGQHFGTWGGSSWNYPGNPSSFPGYGGAYWDGSQPSVMDPTNCQALKDAGATVAVLNIPYIQVPLINATTNYESIAVNGFSPQIPAALTKCASSGFFYQANTPTDITNTLNAMFNQAVQVAHLTK